MAWRVALIALQLEPQWGLQRDAEWILIALMSTTTESRTQKPPHSQDHGWFCGATEHCYSAKSVRETPPIKATFDAKGRLMKSLPAGTTQKLGDHSMCSLAWNGLNFAKVFVLECGEVLIFTRCWFVCLRVLECICSLFNGVMFVTGSVETWEHMIFDSYCHWQWEQYRTDNMNMLTWQTKHKVWRSQGAYCQACTANFIAAELI